MWLLTLDERLYLAPIEDQLRARGGGEGHGQSVQ